ncbi:MAG: hypothetical protein NZ949_07805, partial [Candidatus Kapabacteria bacterium]|nr:hypothetical protein [Candidatus Kapabacteria bacterium]
GTYLVTTAEEGIVKLWNAATLEAADVLVVGTRSNMIYSAAFVGDSNQVLIALDSTLLLYDRPSRQRLHFGIGIHSGPIRDIAVHPSGRLAATAADDSLVCVWDLPTRQHLTCWSEPGVRSWYSVAFSSDGSLLAYGGDNGIIYVRPWQQPWQPARQLRQHGDSSGNLVIWSINFGTDEQLLLSGGVDRTVRFWDVQTARECARSTDHRFHVRSVRALPWGRRGVSGSLDSTIRQWTPKGTSLGTALQHGGQVLSVDYSPDGRLIASVGRDSALRLWESGIARSGDDTVATVLKYPVRLSLSPLVGAAGKSGAIAIQHQDYTWIPPLRTDSFACRILLRIPAWLLERPSGTTPVGAWDSVWLRTWLRATDTLA